jgi:cell division protein ZapA
VTVKKSPVRVAIVGEEYAIRSDAGPERTRAVAEYLDQAIRGVINSGSTVIEPHKAAILAAMQITHELFEAREASDEVATATRALSGELRRLLPPGKRGETPG